MTTFGTSLVSYSEVVQLYKLPYQWHIFPISSMLDTFMVKLLIIFRIYLDGFVFILKNCQPELLSADSY